MYFLPSLFLPVFASESLSFVLFMSLILHFFIGLCTPFPPFLHSPFTFLSPFIYPLCSYPWPWYQGKAINHERWEIFREHTRRHNTLVVGCPVAFIWCERESYHSGKDIAQDRTHGRLMLANSGNQCFWLHHNGASDLHGRFVIKHVSRSVLG
jgi:hypothetical protein